MSDRGATEALIEGIAHKMAVELGAELTRVRGAVAIHYGSPLHHPWPRAVDVTLDILADGLASAGQASRACGGAAHRAHVFGCDVQADADAIAAAGYDACWNTQLLAHDLAEGPRPLAPNLTLEQVESAEQVDALNALEPDFPSFQESLGQPAFFDLLGRCDGRAVAKGQLVCASSHGGYVADMFTAPEARSAGHAGALLQALHNEARRRGLPRTVLIPSRAAADSSFYEKRGYHRVSVDAVLLSKG